MPQHKFLLDESQMPTHWYNIVPDLPVAAARRRCTRARCQPVGPGRPRAAVPDGPDPAGGHHRAATSTSPDEVLRRLPAVAALAAVPGAPAGAGARHAGAHLLQVRGRLAGRVAQAEHRRPAGVLQREERRPAVDDRDRRRAVGDGARVRLRAVRARLRGVAGPGLLRPEALPAHRSWRPSAAPCTRSPSELTEAGREDPRRASRLDPARLGIAISEAVEVAAQDADTNYALGSVLNHVLLHQTVIGEEALLQMGMAGEQPDLIVGCTGGGSNFAGLAFPFLREKLAGRMSPTIRAVEPASCPSLTRGVYAYDFGDTAGLHAADEDAHARPRLHPRPDPRGRAALPRHEPADQPRVRARADRGDRDAAERVLRGGRAVRPDRGHRPGAGADARARRLASRRR